MNEFASNDLSLVIPQRGQKLIAQWHSEISRASKHTAHCWMATAAYFIRMQIRMRREATRSDRSNPRKQ